VKAAARGRAVGAGAGGRRRNEAAGAANAKASTFVDAARTLTSRGLR